MNPTIPRDKQQLFNVGDRVARAIDLSATFWKQGTVTTVTQGTPSNDFSQTYFYSVTWDDGTAGEHYMGSGLVLAPICVDIAT